MRTSKLFALPLALMCAVPLLAGNEDPVLMEIGNDKIKLSEFEYLYHKNSQQQLEKETLDEYVKRFVVYKLKVADAKAAGIDTTSAFQKEFATYLLLGMKKTTLFFLFACEIVSVGMVCFAVGGLFSLLLYNLCFTFFQKSNIDQLSMKTIGKGTLYSSAYFCLVEICVLLRNNTCPPSLRSSVCEDLFGQE